MTDEGYQIRETLLKKVEQFLTTNTHSHKHGGISDKTEMKMWLVDTIANLDDSGDIHARLEETANNKIEGYEKEFIHQVLLLACHAQPKEVAKVLMYDGRIFQRFFRNDDDRAVKWFQHFKFSGENEYGALALERYLFDSRDELWEKLQWNGKQNVTPCVAVQKRNLLLELDVQHAVDMLVHEDDFWTSRYFQESLVSGDFLAMDYEYFVQVLEAKLEGSETSAVRNMMKSYLKRESTKELSQQLIRLLTDRELLNLLYHSLSGNKKLPFIEFVISECKWKNLDELLLYNTLATHTHILVSRIIKDEEGKDLPTKMDELLVDDPNGSQQAYHEWLTQKSAGASKKGNENFHLWVRFIALEAFLVFYRLKQHVNTREGLETMFENFGVTYEALYEKATEEAKEKKKDKKHKHKKQKRDRSESPVRQFIGWNLSNADEKEKSEKVTYGVSEAPQYLYNVFVNRLYNTIN
eukprot:Phypoly_transcript_08556.p1 GENE.Phypoly_transcript_08556~~Phypoly_transcript_08556.p1  ORF type:complete len:467 (+),score=88.69 Phypoly_transcript_08556:94-1494(+)